jgi:hypothetical protein
MKSFLRSRGPTIAVAALMFVAGGATVTTAQNLITSADIKDGQVKTADLGKGAVKSPKIADGQVKTADLGKGAVKSPKIADGQVKRADLINGGVNSAKIANGGVANADLANNAVNSAKIASGGVANADLANNAVNSAKIANGGVANADLANNAVNSAKVADGTITSADIANGTIAIGDISAAAQDALTAYSGANWSIMDRNVIGGGDSYLRAGPTVGPVAPPLGVGSLGIRTGSGEDKAHFGNQVDFIGDEVSALTAVSYWMFTTAENIVIDPRNLPNIAIEIDANLTTIGSDFTTMVYQPRSQVPLIWRERDAVADPDPHWRLTGSEGDEIGCNDVTFCTFEELVIRLADGGDPAIILSVGISKGRDFAFSGAVDALRINDVVYDFEPNGVFETPAP